MPYFPYKFPTRLFISSKIDLTNNPSIADNVFPYCLVFPRLRPLFIPREHIMFTRETRDCDGKALCALRAKHLEGLQHGE